MRGRVAGGDRDIAGGEEMNLVGECLDANRRTGHAVYGYKDILRARDDRICTNGAVYLDFEGNLNGDGQDLGALAGQGKITGGVGLGHL